MKEKQHEVELFLDKNDISLNSYNVDEDIKSFISEMQLGLDSGSSIPMLPTYVEDEKAVPHGEKVLVLDAGGTNLRTAIVSFSESREAVISKFKKRGMPGVEKEISREDFFDTIAEFIMDLATDVEKIGFCFSYPMVKTAEKDGRLIKFSKEIKAPEVEGQLIGGGLLEALEKRGINNIKKIVLLNDTVATLLAGKAAETEDEFDGYVGLILGTGLNASYHEANTNIGKAENLEPGGSQLINMETGSCSILKSGESDRKFREKTVNPDSYKLEKMVSGGYLGALWVTLLKSAADDGLFSSDFSESVGKVCASGSEFSVNGLDLSIFLSTGKLPDLLGTVSGKDLEAALQISSALVKRAAYLVSVMLCAILKKSRGNRISGHPVCICADGTTFWKLHGLKELVEENLDAWLKDGDLEYKIIKIENAPVIGAAVAGLTN